MVEFKMNMNKRYKQTYLRTQISLILIFCLQNLFFLIDLLCENENLKI